MKNNHLIFLLVFFLFSQFVVGQEMPLDFEDEQDVFSEFNGGVFSFNTDPEDPNNQVGRFFNTGNDPWGGFTIGLIRSVDLDFQKTISLSFYSFDSNAHTLLLKLEEGDNPDVEVTLNIPAGSGWTHDLNFDFANAVLSGSNNVSVDASGTYNRLTVFIDGGVSSSGTYLIDNIDDGSEDTGGNPFQIDVTYNNLVWEDNFDTPGPINSANWHHQTKVLFPGVGWANGEEQHYTNRIENSFVEDGFLNIVAKKEIFPDQNLTKNYTSARLNSKFAFTYGRVDVRAKIPIESGTWPAIWMLGKNINENGGFWQPSFGNTGWPDCGEIDIMEHGIFSSQNINYIGSALHSPCCFGGEPNGGGIIANDLANAFHVYSVNWSPDQITFLLDGVGFYTYRPAIKNLSTWPFFEDQYILLNIAIGGFAGATDPGFTESPMIIDYVRVFQEDVVSVEDRPNLDNSVAVYPNPASDQLTIDSEVAPTRVVLYDVYGKKILQQTANTNNLDIHHLTPGIYLMELYFGNEKLVKKVVVD